MEGWQAALGQMLCYCCCRGYCHCVLSPERPTMRNGASGCGPACLLVQQPAVTHALPAWRIDGLRVSPRLLVRLLLGLCTCALTSGRLSLFVLFRVLLRERSVTRAARVSVYMYVYECVCACMHVCVRSVCVCVNECVCV